MKGAQLNNSRRDALKTMFQGTGFLGLGNRTLDGLKASELALRPPGALAEKAFIEACVRCGNCIGACPHDALILATIDDHTAIGTPFFEPRGAACHMCADIPCVEACNSGALDPTLLVKATEGRHKAAPDVNLARMGLAVIDEEACLAFWDIQCDACYRACPLADKAISMVSHRDVLKKHTGTERPIVNPMVCTGCGLCEHACVTDKASIFVLPKEIGSSKAGRNYVKAWEKRDIIRRQKQQLSEVAKDQAAVNYLNDWESLLED